MKRLARALRRAALVTQGGPLRPFWSFAQAAFVRLFAAHLRRGDPDATVYLRRSSAGGDQVFGLSDTDLALVTSSHERAARARARYERARQVLPPLGHLVDLACYDETALREAAGRSILSARGAAYDGAGPGDELWLLKRPGLYRPLGDWRALTGARRELPDVEYDAQARRLAAWLELVVWWGYAIQMTTPPLHWSAHDCAKLGSEPARIWLWLAHGERPAGRAAAIARALELLPDEAPALERARAMIGDQDPPEHEALAELLAHLLRQSQRIGALIAEEIAPAGSTAVRLLGADGPLALPPDGPPRARVPAMPSGPVLPLCDWVGRTASPLVDEGFAVLPLDPAQPYELAVAAWSAGAAQPALRADGLLLMPRAAWGSPRTISTAASDPVSFALLEGAAQAAFPEVAGWSAADAARRAVAEHAARLPALEEQECVELRAQDPSVRNAGPTTLSLARLLSAARAAHFAQTVEEGDPELALCAAALAARLRERGEPAADAVERATEAHRRARGEGSEPGGEVVSELRAAVAALPAYARWRSHTLGSQ